MFGETAYLFRGTTVFFSTTFYDQNNNIVQPSGASVTLVFPDPGGEGTDTATVAMTAPSAPATNWTAEWDSRASGAGAVSGTVYTAGGPPVAVGDFEFVLSANPANLAASL